MTGLPSCQPSTKRIEREQPALDEAYVPTERAVGFNLLPLQSSGGTRRWLATYTDENGTTKFSIELKAPATPEAANPSLSTGAFHAEAGSNPLPLLQSLKKALEAKHMPKQTKQAEVLPFEYMILGDHQSRSSSGSFSHNPGGNWIATKIFLAGDQAEVYLNLNPELHQAEFSIKDADYGDAVLAELAKVL
jgi:hypothetical protein